MCSIFGDSANMNFAKCGVAEGTGPYDNALKQSNNEPKLVSSCGLSQDGAAANPIPGYSDCERPGLTCNAW